MLCVRARKVIYANVHTERPETPPQPFATIPFVRDCDFIDRGDILEQVSQRCSEPAGRVALVGLGGIGYVYSRAMAGGRRANGSRKSQLAIEFAHRTAEEADNR